MAKYWIGKEPSSDVTSEQAKDLAQFAKDVSVGAVDALDGAASPENAAKATKTLKVTINGTDYWIPLYTANTGS